MKAFFVTIYKAECYSGIFEVEGKTITDCVEAGIQEFDRENISGEGHTIEQIIKDTAIEYVEKDEHRKIKADLIPYLTNYFHPDYMTTYLIYVNDDGKLIKEPTNDHVKKMFEPVLGKVREEVEKIEKEKRKQKYKELKEEFEEA
jgi:hypothetical protein